MRIKKCFYIIAATVVLSSSMTDTIKADNDGSAREIGIECVGNYSTWSSLEDLESPINIANDFYSAFSDGAKNWKINFKLTNNAVYENDFKAKSLGGNDHKYADNVDLLIYAGHGVMPGKYGASDYSFALNTKQNTKYAKQGEMYLGNKDLEWLVTFTCNFLQSQNLDTIGRMARGIHAICGFESSMIITAKMGPVFASKLKRGYSVKESFLGTVKETKVWYDSGGRAGVFTTKANADDRLWGYGSVAADPPSYKKNPSGYILYSYEY